MNTKNITCCFTGHRNIPDAKHAQISAFLREEIVKLINSGVIYFIAGGALGFDTMAAQIVLKLKTQYSQVKLILILPCKTQTQGWNESDIAIYESIKKACDKYVYTSEKYTRGCMHKRNRHLVDNSSRCICYLTKNSGGTVYTIEYAKSKGLEILDIGEK